MKPSRKQQLGIAAFVMVTALLSLMLWVRQVDYKLPAPTVSEIRRDGESTSENTVKAVVIPSAPQPEQQPIASEDSAARRQRDLELARRMEAQLDAHDWAVEKITPFGRQINALKSLLNRYYDTYGKYPEGSTSEIISALAGNNPQGLSFIKDPKFAGGLTLDQFGTVLSIQLGRKKYEMEIRSAGLDRQFSTSDDQVVNWYADVRD